LKAAPIGVPRAYSLAVEPELSACWKRCLHGAVVLARVSLALATLTNRFYFIALLAIYQTLAIIFATVKKSSIL
jgi:hypothetical protein